MALSGTVARGARGARTGRTARGSHRGPAWRGRALHPAAERTGSRRDPAIAAAARAPVAGGRRQTGAALAGGRRRRERRLRQGRAPRRGSRAGASLTSRRGRPQPLGALAAASGRRVAGRACARPSGSGLAGECSGATSAVVRTSDEAIAARARGTPCVAPAADAWRAGTSSAARLRPDLARGVVGRRRVGPRVSARAHASRSLTGVTLSTYGLSGSDSQSDRVKEMRTMALFGQQTRKDDGFPRTEDRVEPQVEVAPYLAPVPHVPARSMEDTRPTMTNHAQELRVDSRRGPHDRGEDRV